MVIKWANVCKLPGLMPPHSKCLLHGRHGYCSHSLFSSGKVIVLMYPKIKLADRISLAATYVIDSYGIYSKGKSLRLCFSNQERTMTEPRGKSPSHLYLKVRKCPCSPDVSFPYMLFHQPQVLDFPPLGSPGWLIINTVKFQPASTGFVVACWGIFRS